MRRDRVDAEYEAARFAVDGTVTGTETIARVDDGTSWRAAVVATRCPIPRIPASTCPRASSASGGLPT
ncbi:MAG: hypothetical protein FWJ87_15580 [Micromonosporaceae bacterium]|nr:hypothetical protein [Natronosporangium sp.]